MSTYQNIRDEQIEQLRENVKGNVAAADKHRNDADGHQKLVDRALEFAAKFDERARQWQQLLDLALANAAPPLSETPLAVAFGAAEDGACDE